MSLSQKVLFFIAFVYLATILSLIAVSKITLEDRFSRLEQQKVDDDLHRILNAIDEKLNSLDITVADYAGWDDTYKFIQDANKAYIDSNLVDETFNGIRVNLMVFLNENGTIVFAKAYDLVNEQQVALPEGLDSLLTKDSPLTANKNLEEGVTGIANLPEGQLLISSRPITTSKKGGPLKGYLIMGRFLDNELIDIISTSTKLPVQIKEGVLKIDTLVYSENNQTTKGFLAVPDIYGTKNIVIETHEPRDIYIQGQQTIKIFVAMFLLIGFGSLLFGSFFLEKVLIVPIKRLVNDVDRIRQSGNTKQKVSVIGKNEISHLADEVNKMLSALNEYSNRLLTLNKELDEQKRGVELKVEERTKELKEEHVKLRSAIDSTPYGFVLIDKFKSVVLSNKALTDMLKLKNIGNFEALSALFKDKVDFEKHYSLALNRATPTTLNEIDLGNKILKLVFTPVRTNENTTIGVIFTVNDITEATILERSKEELFIIASHELKTPLTAIKGNTDLLKNKYYSSLKDANLKGMVDDINTATLRMIHIVNDFLTTSKLEQGKIEFASQDFSVDKLIQDTLREWEAAAEQKGIKLKYQSESIHDDFFVRADSDKTKEVLANLLANAIAYTDNGEIVVTTRQVDGSIETEVADTGKGILPENQKLLFRKFQQAGPSIYSRDVSQGTGLGLYISKLMVEAMKGKIYLKNSQKDVGSIFGFSLPAKKMLK